MLCKHILNASRAKGCAQVSGQAYMVGRGGAAAGGRPLITCVPEAVSRSSVVRHFISSIDLN